MIMNYLGIILFTLMLLGCKSSKDVQKEESVDRLQLKEVNAITIESEQSSKIIQSSFSENQGFEISSNDTSTAEFTREVNGVVETFKIKNGTFRTFREKTGKQSEETTRQSSNIEDNSQKQIKKVKKQKAKKKHVEHRYSILNWLWLLIPIIIVIIWIQRKYKWKLIFKKIVSWFKPN